MCVFRNLCAIIPIFNWNRDALPPISLAQLPQVLAWHELECAPCPAQGLAKLHSEEARAKHPLRLDSVNADVLELAEDLLDQFRMDENSLGDDVLDQERLGWTSFGRV